MGPVEPGQIDRLGCTLSEEKPGPFELGVDCVKITPVRSTFLTWATAGCLQGH